MNFEYGEGATARKGCGVVFKGEYLYFGGNGANGQVSQSSIAGYNISCQLSPSKFILVIFTA